MRFLMTTARWSWTCMPTMTEREGHTTHQAVIHQAL